MELYNKKNISITNFAVSNGKKSDGILANVKYGDVEVRGNVAAYCVQCRTDGKVNLAGRIRWNDTALEVANLTLQGSFNITAQLGLVAGLKASEKITKPILTQPIPVGIPLGVPQIFAIGPAVTLKALVELEVGVEGQILFGANASITNFTAEINFLDQSGKSNSTVNATQYFQGYETSISASAGLALPIALGFGLEIPALDYSNSVTITDKSGVKVGATYRNGTLCKPNTCQNGIDYRLDCMWSL